MEPVSAQPLVQPKIPESMQAYFTRLEGGLNREDYTVVDTITEDGLYVGKRAIRGAQGQGDLLNQAGTVFYHTVLYIKANGKISALDYGPQGAADVTANVMEAAPCAAVLHETATPDAGHPLVKVNFDHLGLDNQLVKEALQFAESRKYHAVNNNCIHNTDFLCRVLTEGKVRNAPMIYDALAGKVPQQDHPMLLMFFLMTRLSWFHVCDGSKVTKDFMTEKGLISKPEDPTRSDLDAPKPAAQSRLEEKQIDLMQLIQGLQAGSSGTPGEPRLA